MFLLDDFFGPMLLSGEGPVKLSLSIGVSVGVSIGVSIGMSGG